MSAFHVTVKRGGQIALPEQWLEANQVKEGDLVQLADIGDGVIILMHRKNKPDRKQRRNSNVHKPKKSARK